ncbi:unnamed protein product [Rhizoctonia solani]|uniref:Amine oxidase domain-containing protein n=1 Tax=Rhizoctonia solani TaxID=456999 RepID=A0A8H2W556_9AGAM|nr:unnamed protein product [Rhizoctonia solani]
MSTEVHVSVKIFQLWGQILLDKYHTKRLDFENPLPPTSDTLPGAPNERAKTELPKVNTPVKRIAIVGGGVAGLYAAMLLKEDKHEFKVDIYEASDRIGGRLYTRRLDGKSAIGTPVPGGEYDYFDVGAMRFPDTPVMAKTFELFKKLKIKLLHYNLGDDENWLVYNDIRYKRKDITAKIWSTDPFKVGQSNGGTVPDEWAKQDPSELLSRMIQPFIDALIKNPEEELKRIIEKYDHYSTRSYLSEKGPYPPAVINWIETMSVGTGWFDRALIETILEELAFKYDSKLKMKWRCVDGGSEVIPLKMVEWLKENAKETKIHTSHRVTAVEYKNHELTISGICHPLLTGDSSFFKETYSHVIFAIPPPCLRMIDLDTCQLDFAQRSAIRQLQLAPSIKIGMKFKKPAWWTGINQDIVGGQSTTDRTARTIVYPSHGSGNSTVLIASYAWRTQAQDSLVLGAMMHGPGSPEEERLKQVMLADLAYVHKEDGITLERLIDEFEGMYAFDWTNNPLSMGAFGLFGPSQFREFYRHVTRPAARGQIHFVGEAFSTTHGWVAGALNSAARGVCQLLQYHQLATQNTGKEENLVDDLVKDWDPELEVNRKSMFLQIIASLLLEQDEFGGKK